MLIYTVRCEFPDAETRERYLRWLADGHSQAVVDYGGALSSEIVSYDDGSVETRYVFPSREAFEAYQNGPAVAMRAEAAALFSGLRITRNTGVPFS